MFQEISELRLAQADGGLPTALAAGSVRKRCLCVQPAVSRRGARQRDTTTAPYLLSPDSVRSLWSRGLWLAWHLRRAAGFGGFANKPSVLAKEAGGMRHALNWRQ